MPELPEVETVVRTLENLIKNEKIKKVKVYWDNIVVGDVKEFENKLINQSFREFKRLGKYIIFELDDYALISHLRMEGKYYVYQQSEAKAKHCHVIFEFESLKQLHYVDTRKFGKMELVLKQKNYCIKNLGFEPWDNAYNLSYFKQYIKNLKQPVKALLLDQSFVAGIGNIYADEILFLSKVHPEKQAKELNDEQMLEIIKNTRLVLEKAIKLGGTTIRSYTSSLGVTGRFQNHLNVHQKAGEPCVFCGNSIKKIKVKTRGTYYCPHCQKL